MLGGIVGDIVGSVYEWNRIKTKDFPLFSECSKFTDDTVLTCATAKVLLDGGSYEDAYTDFAERYPGRGYGQRFSWWVTEWKHVPYDSFGNGSAMRVGPVGWARQEEEAVLSEARDSAVCTHDHPEGIKGAQATALAIYMARNGKSKDEIKNTIEQNFAYVLSRTVDDIRPEYSFDVTCQGSVPEAMICFLESTDFEDAIRNAVSLGGDSDTQACIAGSIAEAFYGGVPEGIASNAMEILPNEFRDLVDRFRAKFL